jgi:hypothetical protein
MAKFLKTQSSWTLLCPSLSICFPGVPGITGIGFHDAQCEVLTSKSSCQEKQWHLEDRGKTRHPAQLSKFLSPNNLLKYGGERPGAGAEPGHWKGKF